MILGGTQYRRFGDDKMFVVDREDQLECPGPEDCSYENLETGDYVTVRPKGAAATAELPTAPKPYVAPTLVQQRAAKDVLIEATALGLMGAGAVAFGYGLGKPSGGWAVAGTLLVFAGAGLRLSVLIPFLKRIAPAAVTAKLPA
jgi:hypothetical protein